MNFFKKKKQNLSLTQKMVNSMVSLGIIDTFEGLPYSPEIVASYKDNVSAIFHSDYMKKIPVSEYTTGVYNAMRFAFAFGVISASEWNNSLTSFENLSFKVDISEILLAMKLLDIDKNEYESIIGKLMEVYIEYLNQINNPDIPSETNYVLINTQTIGTAAMMKKLGYK
ncbi:hypothetical protein NBE98_03055 [Clostridium swellfunianum]|uniref:hypothetical protein n=1 Tax=Clostridium swellfunianum TaxID=1367462 RepID=UPI002030EE9B|nr:hypothetical protein [Clostridium swellfunianum]MCM0647353.1 hypothetical protein [Clostridium swellfunianum]